MMHTMFFCLFSSDEISEDGGEPDTSVSDQPVSAMKVTWAAEGGSEEGADDSDLGTLSQASSDRDTADGLRETSVEPDIFTSQEDRRKAAEEKVCISCWVYCSWAWLGRDVLVSFF